MTGVKLKDMFFKFQKSAMNCEITLHLWYNKNLILHKPNKNLTFLI